MSDAELIECLICGNRYRSLGHHVRFAHGVSPDEYRDRNGIRRCQPLTAPVTHERFREAIARQIEDGRLAAHYAANASRTGPEVWERSARVKRELADKGVQFAPSRKPAPREVIEVVVVAVEGGTARKVALAKTPISEAVFYANLKRHPDLKARLAACFARSA